MPKWIWLDELRPGAIFETIDGIRAVKSEYHYPNGAPECVLLESGEYAHFPNAGRTTVREIDLDTIVRDALRARDEQIIAVAQRVKGWYPVDVWPEKPSPDAAAGCRLAADQIIAAIHALPDAPETEQL